MTAIPLRAAGEPLDTSPEAFGELRRTPSTADPATLRTNFAEDGYLFMPGFLNPSEVLAARRSILLRLQEEGALDPNQPLMEAVARAGLDLAFRPDLANGNPEVAGLLYGDPVMRLYSALCGEPARHYDYTWLRAMAPGKGTPAHYDIVYMGRGTHDVFTAWVPLGEVPRHHGALMMLEGSHRLEDLKADYGTLDVDAVCENKAGIPEWVDRGTNHFGGLTESPNRLRQRFGGRWLTSDFAAGDLLTFSMFTLHASLDNLSDRIRLSTDSRYQAASQPADERWIGPNPPGHGPDAKRGVIC